MRTPSWFDIDKAGLAKLMARRGKQFVIFELVQNAYDAPEVTRVEITLTPVPGRPLVDLCVRDDSPQGFARLAHAFTLFSESDKKTDPEKRGRFCLGEKTVLALAERAVIRTTTGTVSFDDTGRRQSRTATARGSSIELRLPMTRAEIDQVRAAARQLLPPVPTTIDGERIEPRTPASSIDATLPTEVADEEGVLRRMPRKTRVAFHPVQPGETATLYEMGIPVVEIPGVMHADIGQKVPLSLERDNVSPAYLRQILALALNVTAPSLTPDEAAQPWVTQALGHRDAAPDAVRQVITARYGERAVIYDPSDAEANALAVTKGYAVVHGGAFGGAEWEAIKQAGALRPAGQVTPSPKPWAEGGTPVSALDPTPAMQAHADWARRVARQLIGRDIAVRFYPRFNDRSAAAYGGGELQYNVGVLGKAYFERPIGIEHVDLLLHELGHEYEGNHLDAGFHRALTRLGAQLALAVSENPGLLVR